MSAVCAPSARPPEPSNHITLGINIFINIFRSRYTNIQSMARCVLENMGIERKDMRIICKHPPVLSRFPCVSVCVCFCGAVFLLFASTFSLSACRVRSAGKILRAIHYFDEWCYAGCACVHARMLYCWRETRLCRMCAAGAHIRTHMLRH